MANTPIWARFMRVDFLKHYGSEFYCPVSVLRVFGKTMMEDLRNHQPKAPTPPPPTPPSALLNLSSAQPLAPPDTKVIPDTSMDILLMDEGGSGDLLHLINPFCNLNQMSTICQSKLSHIIPPPPPSPLKPHTAMTTFRCPSMMRRVIPLHRLRCRKVRLRCLH